MPLSPAWSPRSAWTWQYSPNVFLRAEWEYIGFVPVAGIRANINTGRVGIGVKF